MRVPPSSPQTTVFTLLTQATATLKGTMALVSLCILLGSLFLSQGTAFAVQAKPPTDASFYMFQPDSNEAYNLGCDQGIFDKNNGNSNSLVIIDVGGQSSSTDYNAIEAEAEQFAQAYIVCTSTDSTSTLSLNIGTNNSVDVSYADGVTWANTVNAVADWVVAAGYNTQVSIGGANDIEPGFGSASAARTWADGYSSVTANSFGSAYLNYGSADGCPPYGSCANGWTQNDVWYVSWGANAAVPMPEIYYTSQAQEWANLSLYSAQNLGGPMFILGPMDEYDLDTTTLTSDGSWNALWTQLNNNSATAQNLNYSTEIQAISF